MKPNKYQIKFTEDNIEINKLLFDVSDRDIKKLMSLQKEDRDKILNEVANIMLKYEIVENVMNLSDIEKMKINKEITNSITSIFKEQAEIESKDIGNLLNNIAKDKYYLNSFNLSLGLDFNLKKIDSKTLNRIINKTIKGKNYSDRIWSNKNNIAKILQKEIKDFIEGRTSVNKINTILRDRFNQSAYVTKRLISNETARVMEESNNKWMEDLGVDYVMYMGTLDNHTCSDCGEHDGQVYKRGEEPVETPVHVGCRCTYSPIPSSEWRPKKRMNNETKNIISWNSYNDWKKENNI